MKSIQKRARQLKTELKPGFGAKPVVELLDIVDTAKSAGTFQTLLTAAEAAGLVGTLKGNEPLTVFAPTGVLNCLSVMICKNQYLFFFSFFLINIR